MRTSGKVPYLGEHENVILFDGVCKLCNAWSNFLLQHDTRRRFRLASVQSAQGQAILAHFAYPTDYFDTMLVVRKGVCFEKSDAFFVVMAELGWPWKLTLVFKLIPRPLRNRLYDRIALNRYRLFGKYEVCSLPAPDHAGRFLGGS